ncbi:MAG: histidine ammonia-lyase, partial [Flavobacteriales bacterium]|nr:histidine ammonia-lyase [Flavobacteriales bacterium]
MEDHHIAPVDRSIEALYEVLTQRKPILLSPDAKARIEKCRNYLDAKLENNDAPIYGINTGFGSLCDTRISNDDLGTLQRNLVLSHACGAGPTVPQEIVRWMLLLKARALSFGHSGVQLATVQRLLDLLNNNLIPVVYELGSLGASGDLAPLAHLSLPLIGEGQVWQSEGHKATKEVYWNLNWEPIQLKAKEGLALLNGTQFMSAYGCHLVMRARRLMKWADLIAAMSLEAFDGRIEPFGVEVNAIRRQEGQILVAENMRNILAGSELIKQHKKHVQDPYSFRCIPQVHGASRDAIAYAGRIVENEINAVTDNPTIFPDQDMIVSAGNFHGQPLALALDNLAIALAELGSISERRTYKLISGQRELPPFLVANPGLNSGFMIPQYTAASIVSQNKVLCHPASVDTIDSSNGQEDHVSMGANAATKAFRVGQNVQRIMAIELMNAAQALELR